MSLMHTSLFDGPCVKVSSAPETSRAYNQLLVMHSLMLYVQDIGPKEQQAYSTAAVLHLPELPS